MPGRMIGKRVLLTGGVANIGLSILESFIAEGATVVLVDRDERRGGAVAQRFEDKVRFIRADVSQESEIIEAVGAAIRFLGGLDTLCLNAGVQLSGKVDDFSAANWDMVFAVNVRANFIFVREALPHLREAGRSSIVMMSSLAGKRGAAGLVSYSASKAAVLGMVSAMAIELAPHGIRVNAVCPGWIDTPFNHPAIAFMGGREKQNAAVRAAIPLGRQAEPGEVAPLFVYLACDESSYVTAQAINVDGGAYN